MHINNKKILKGFFGVLVLLVILWVVYGNMYIKTTHVTIKNNHIPSSFNDYKIAHLSDLHGKEWGNQLIDQLEKESPDLIFITGDLIDRRTTDLNPTLQFIEEINDLAPIYYVTGNHEATNEHYNVLESLLLKKDVTVLRNEGFILEKDNQDIKILGVDDPTILVREMFSYDDASTLSTVLDSVVDNYEGFTILLSHRPELFDVYIEKDINLIFSGHAHGGQFRLPIIGGLIAPDQGFFPKYTSEKYVKGNSTMIVSRGLGNSIIPIRINNNPELLFIHLEV